MRTLGRVLCWLVVVAAGFLALVCAGLIIDGDDGDTRLGGAVILVACLAVVAAAWVGQRALKDRGRAETSADVTEAQHAVQAGEPLTLYPARGRRAGLFVLALALVAGAVLFALAAPNVFVRVVAGGFALLFAFSTIELLPGTGSLRIAQDGLTVRTTLRRRHWAWNDIEHFRAYQIHYQYGSKTLVGFDRRDMTPQRQGVWRTLNRGMSGVDESLPESYGLPHEALAELLDVARERYATEHGISESERADRAIAERVARIRTDHVPLVTAVLTAACVALFLSEADRFGLFPTAGELADAGGASRDGAWWTLLTANVLHANPIHLVLNLGALLVLGWLLERELGWLRFGVLCVVAGAASMGLAVLLQPNGVTVGVSGIIFGIAGFALVRDLHRTRALGAVAWSIVPVGLVYTFFVPHVSIGAHIGGLLAGLLLAFALERAGGMDDAWLTTSRRSPSA